MSIDIEQLKVYHNEAASRFEAEIAGLFAVVDYERRGEVLYITHTGTPLRYRGQGIAGKVTEAALDYAQRTGLHVVPLCSFTSSYIRRHPHYQSLVQSER